MENRAGRDGVVVEGEDSPYFGKNVETPCASYLLAAGTVTTALQKEMTPVKSKLKERTRIFF